MKFWTIYELVALRFKELNYKTETKQKNAISRRSSQSNLQKQPTKSRELTFSYISPSNLGEKEDSYNCTNYLHSQYLHGLKSEVESICYTDCCESDLKQIRASKQFLLSSRTMKLGQQKITTQAENVRTFGLNLIEKCFMLVIITVSLLHIHLVWTNSKRKIMKSS